MGPVQTITVGPLQTIVLNCVTTEQFQNLRTRELRGAPSTGPTTMIDLDSPTLVSNICRPLRQLIDENLVFSYSPPGLGGTFGGFALDETAQWTYLERCGSRMRRRLPALPGVRPLMPWLPTTGNAHALLWQQSRQLSGMFLPSGRQFTIPLPAALRGLGTTFVLSLRTLWALTPRGALWTTAAPRQ